MSRLVFAALCLVLAPCVCTAASSNKEQIVYDFWSPSSPYEIQQILKGLKVLHKFKVFGVDRYLIVIENDQSDQMKNLKLPRDAYNIRAIPVEKSDVFHSHFQATTGNSGSSSSSLPESNLTFLELDWSPDYNQQELMSIIREQTSTQQLKSGQDIEMFVATASLPIKHMIFMSRTDDETTELLLKDADCFGGQKRLRVEVQKIHKI